MVVFDEELEFDVEDDDDDLLEGLELAAWAIAALPPISAPERVMATRAFPNPCRMVVHLLPVRRGASQAGVPGRTR